MTNMYKKCESYGEKATRVCSMVEFMLLIWGSVVVFGAWARWTDDFDKYKNNRDEWNYCMYTPMILAFTLLLIKWVSSINGATKY